MKAVLLIGLLFVAGCNLAGLDETTLTVSSSQEDTRLIAVREPADTLFTLDGSGSLSAPVEAGDSVTIFIYVYDISGELLLYNTRGFSIEEGQSVKYKI